MSISEYSRAGVLGGGVLLLALVSGPVFAGPTCEGLGGIENHGQHIVGDYVTGLGGIGGGVGWPPSGEVGEAVAGTGATVPGGPAAKGHFNTQGLPPGASFCVDKAHPNGFDTPDVGGPNA